MKRDEKAITLIALVVTIIVLLILAGVTIAMVLGQDGIFKKAQTAEERTDETQEIEQVRVAVLEAKTNYITGDKSKNFIFYNCSNLTNLDVSKFNTSNVTNMSFMFGIRCPIIVGANWTLTESDANYSGTFQHV